MMSVALAAVAHEQGCDVFGINGPDGQMVTARISPTSQAPLTPLISLGGAFSGAPAASVGGELLPARGIKGLIVDVVARGLGGQLLHRSSVNGIWSPQSPQQPWPAAAGACLRTPAVTSVYALNSNDPTDSRDLVGVGLDNRIFWIRAAGTNWTPPPDTDLGGDFVTSPGVVRPSGVDLAFFAVDISNQMRARCRHENGVNVTWFPSNSGWFTLGDGVFTSAPAVVVDGPDCDILALGTENQIYHARWRVPPYGNLPADWHGLSGSFNSPPAAVRMTQSLKSHTGFLHVFAVGDDNQLRHRCLTPSSWLPRSEWQTIGGPFTSAPAVAAFANRIWVFGLGPDNHLRVLSWDDTAGALPSNLAWDGVEGDFGFNPEP